MSRRNGPRGLSRRKLLVGVAGGLGATALGAEDKRPLVPDDTTKLQGPPPTEIGERSPFVKPRRLVMRAEPSSGSRTPLQDLRGIITPSDLHFERHHAGIPRIDPERYSLLIHGMVERPTVFSLSDLERFPATSRLYFLECSGNGGEALRDPREDMTPQQIDGLTSTSEWTGVPLALLLREVGALAEARWFLAESMDAAVMTRSIPMGKAWEDAMIAYAQNGEPLRPENGYPVRLFLPGWEGNANVKWLRRIELSDRPFFTREETSKYTDPVPGGKARMFTFDMDAKSIITFPAYPQRLTDTGYWEIRGIAWSGRGVITRVELSVDGGQSWQDAELQEPVLPKCHTRFRMLWNWQGQPATLVSRATDETGSVQPTTEEFRRVRGEGTRYHFNHLRAWRVQKDGKVVFTPA
ncbi:MAG TPA: sulfite dehydrogenase [Vicinamibacteria bacterium]|nr:sulfite dehydrogenase [Vicinamibacteria bacterium]